MNQFTFYSPTKVIFGKGVEEKVGEEIKARGGTKVLLHYGGGSIRKTGLLDRVEKALTVAGIRYFLLGGVKPNPRLSLVQKGIDLCRREGVDFILAVGGGSVMDSVKAIALGVPYQGNVWDFYEKTAEPVSALPHGSIPTLAASGSETSNSSVITNEEGWLKKGLNVDYNRPRFALMDPELLYTLPPYQTACGVTDIMMHTLERYLSPGGVNELTDRIAESVLTTMIQYGPLCLKEPENYEARSEVMWCGSISHNHLTGLGRDGDWACHQLEHELGGKYDVAHGAGLAAVWGSWARYVYHEDVSRFARLGVRVWGLPDDPARQEKTACEGIDRTVAFFGSLGMPQNLKELLGHEISEDELHELAVKCTFYGKRTIGGMKKLGEEDIYQIYKAAQS